MAEKAEPSTNWKTIILTALISTALTTLAALFLFHYQKEKPKLFLQEFPMATFDKDRTHLKIFTYRLVNSGNKHAEDVDVDFSLPNRYVNCKYEVKTSPGKFPHTEVEKDKSLVLTFPRMNQNDEATITVLVEDMSPDKPDKPDLNHSARGINVTAIHSAPPTYTVASVFTLGLTIGLWILILVIGVIFVNLRRFNRKMYKDLQNFKNFQQ